VEAFVVERLARFEPVAAPDDLLVLEEVEAAVQAAADEVVAEAGQTVQRGQRHELGEPGHPELGRVEHDAAARGETQALRDGLAEHGHLQRAQDEALLLRGPALAVGAQQRLYHGQRGVQYFEQFGRIGSF